MKTRKILLNIDLVIQSILLFLAIGSAIGTIISKGAVGIILGYALFFLGAWQLGSGVILGLILRDRKRAEYVFWSIAYLCTIGVFGSLNIVSNDTMNVILAAVFIAAIPLCIAYWYLKLTKNTIEKIKNAVETPEEMKDILDSDEIFKPIGE